jgi:DNA-binding transcriptional LysR family regulator
MWCNPHHLMLFYHVAKHGGIARALPHMPYGIQQPALSGQLISFERELGVSLFSRRPFALSESGQQLYDHVRRFYDPLDDLLEQVQQPGTLVLRIGASELILREYLPGVVAALRQREPNLRVMLTCGSYASLATALHAGKLDLAITGVDDPPAGLEHRLLTHLPLALLVPRPAGEFTVPDLQSPGRLAQPLIGLGTEEGIGRVFHRGLQRRGVVWPATIATNSIALVSWYVAARQGIGVSLDLPVLVKHPKIRAVALPGFDPVAIVALWRKPASPPLRVLLEIIDDLAGRLNIPNAFPTRLNLENAVGHRGHRGKP